MHIAVNTTALQLPAVFVAIHLTNQSNSEAPGAAGGPPGGRWGPLWGLLGAPRGPPTRTSSELLPLRHTAYLRSRGP